MSCFSRDSQVGISTVANIFMDLFASNVCEHGELGPARCQGFGMVSRTGTDAAWQWSRHTDILCTGHGNAKGQAEGGAEKGKRVSRLTWR